MVTRLGKQLEELSLVAQGRLTDLDNHLSVVQATIFPSLLGSLTTYKVVQVFANVVTDPYKPRDIPQLQPEQAAELLSQPPVDASRPKHTYASATEFSKISLEEVEKEFASRLPSEANPTPRTRFTAAEVYVYLMRANIWAFERGGKSGSSLVEGLKVVGAPINLYHYIAQQQRQGIFSHKSEVDREEFVAWTREKETIVTATDLVFEYGALKTTTPFFVAAFKSTWFTPIQKQPIACNFLAASMIFFVI
jgi:hypothetical protein